MGTGEEQGLVSSVWVKGYTAPGDCPRRDATAVGESTPEAFRRILLKVYPPKRKHNL